jgi:hypothetical protein
MIASRAGGTAISMQFRYNNTFRESRVSPAMLHFGHGSYRMLSEGMRSIDMTYPRNFTGIWLFGRGSWLIVVLIGGLIAAWPSGADAQINPFRGYKGPTLSKEDLASGQAAANKLLTEDQAQVGKSEDWSGPTSGNRGSLSIQKAFQRQGMECRTLRSEVHYKKAPASPPRTLNLNVCRTKAGEWKLM